MDFLLAAENTPFTIAIAVMLGIALMEGVATLLGFGVSSYLEALKW